MIGYPLRVVVGPKTLQTGELEVKVRKTGEVSMLPLDGDYITAIKEMLTSCKNNSVPVSAPGAGRGNRSCEVILAWI